MFITKKQHNKEIEEIIIRKEEKIEQLKEELKQARDLKLILDKLYPLYGITSNLFTANGSFDCSINLTDDVLRYVDDILGGKVIKQEGNKCLIIDEEGTVKTGLTKQKTDKGFKYKLIRK